MIGDSEIQELQDNIREMEQELTEKKKALREAKYAGLRTAMQARKDADEAVRQELKELGITPTSFWSAVTLALEILVDGKRFKYALKQGYRSGLEIKVKDHLRERKVRFKYESLKIEWEDLMYRIYTPDFILHNGLIIETKGRFTSDDRRKHMAIKKQHPELDIRFVFENSRRKLSKGAKNTYATWCERNMFLYADRVIPEEWLSEKGKDNHPDLVEFPYDKIKRR